MFSSTTLRTTRFRNDSPALVQAGAFGSLKRVKGDGLIAHQIDALTGNALP